MTHPKILVMGATGKTGTAVVEQLRERDWPVRAIVHRADARSERLQRLSAEIAVADIFDTEQLSAAMRGMRRAYYCPPFDPFMIQRVAAFAVAAQEAKLESIAGLSQWLAGPAHPSLMSRQHWLADRVFSMIPGVAYTIVNPGFFAASYLSLIEFAAQLGAFPRRWMAKAATLRRRMRTLPASSWRPLSIPPSTRANRTGRRTGNAFGKQDGWNPQPGAEPESSPCQDAHVDVLQSGTNGRHAPAPARRIPPLL